MACLLCLHADIREKMDQEPTRDMVIAERERGHFVRAARLALTLELPEEMMRELRSKALWQMAAEWRNPAGTKFLAGAFGISRDSLEKHLMKAMESKSSRGETKSIEPAYDYHTGKYLSFEEWVAGLIKNWNRIPDS
ncbi:MAG: hypothetical protein DRG82_02985 [Deltaproteobacteria bacterium]|nr:MAG: hypothetical protein DRG82_02985 [Deltaproteobacteria bacterium]